MISSWLDLCKAHAPLAGLLPWGGLSAGQQRLLAAINPLQAPVLGFETAQQQRWRRADLAVLLLSQQWSRWSRLLQPWLNAQGDLATDLPIAALSDVLQLEHCRPETWLELCGPLEPGQPLPLMLFKNPQQPLELSAARDLCLAFALQQKTSAAGLPLAIINDDWWADVAARGLTQVHQLGLDLRCRPIAWRLLLAPPSDTTQHLRSLQIPKDWHDELRRWPHLIALIADQDPNRCGLELLPRYRSSLDLSALQQAPPGGAEQWPRLLHSSRLLSTSRRQLFDALGGALQLTRPGGSDLTVLTGVNHLKLSLEHGVVGDLKAYAGAFARARSGAAAPPSAGTSSQDALLQRLQQHWHQHRDEPWQGFQLNPGRSDRWITTAVLCLLAGQREACGLTGAWQRHWTQLQRDCDIAAPIGYSITTPADADSTIWLQRLRLASGLAVNDSLEAFITNHWSTAGISTYQSETGIAAFIGRSVQGCQGWFEPHDCVLANLSALAGPLQQRALTLLRRRVQQQNFNSYWWPAPGWALALVPRGRLPIDGVMQLINRPLSAAVVTCLGTKTSHRLWQAQRALALLRHGNATQRQQEMETLEQLCESRVGFAELACLQIPDPSWQQGRPVAHWERDTGLEGSLNLDQQGHFSAALLGSVLLN